MDDAIVREILESAGLHAPDAVVSPLTGGVSCETFAVALPDRELVVKRALPELKVAERWESDPSRIVAEAAGLDWFHAISAQHVPSPLAVVRELFGVVLPRAPQPSPDLRHVLLNDPLALRPDLGAQLGTLLATWHTADPVKARGGLLDEYDRLISLRVEPFYRDMAKRWPAYSEVIESAADELLNHSTAVVHGDFTPKNVLVLPQGFWVIDTEVAHIGNPVLDTASMLAHLLLKRIHYREHHAAGLLLQNFQREFLNALSDSQGSVPPTLGYHIGIIMGVRVEGRAPVAYLSDSAKAVARDVAIALLEGQEVEEAWSQ